MTPRRLVAKRGAILSFENLPRVRFTISVCESLVLSTTAGSPPMAFRTSSDSLQNFGISIRSLHRYLRRETCRRSANTLKICLTNQKAVDFGAKTFREVD